MRLEREVFSLLLYQEQHNGLRFEVSPTVLSCDPREHSSQYLICHPEAMLRDPTRIQMPRRFLRSIVDLPMANRYDPCLSFSEFAGGKLIHDLFATNSIFKTKLCHPEAKLRDLKRS